MHEFSLCEGIIDTVTTQARQQGFSRVRRVWLEIGELANVELEALRFAFEIVRQDTTAADAELDIISLPGRAHCLDCAQPVAVQQHFDPCPLCGGYQWRLVSGTELRIKELEVE
ncbi:MAG: hydrogenase maturation nickel metallochaperone HypA [Candidatus Contendobacter sp.]|jgi:hydrogenase nickel incorporation protein HypA/HybF|nr:hydrogenase maturation nickel metallochaperone HypA [Gammaproteobacteria bacterium]MCC8993031.1 hydrogenase maturation nickel metallochaperone HypA [Candidatus Contendobacter sp.]